MADDGTRIYEPDAVGTNTEVGNVDTKEIEYGAGDLRDRQRFILAGDDVDTDVVVTDVTPDDDALALVVRLAGGSTSGTDLDNQFTTPMDADEVFEGVWKNVQEHGSLLALYAIQPTSEAPLSVQVQFSDDESTVIATSNLTQKIVTSGPFTYAVYLSIVNGSFQGKFARLKVTNGPVAQTQNPIVFFARNKFPFSGTYGGLDSSLTFFSQALLTRSVGAALRPDGAFVNSEAPGVDPGNTTTTLLAGAEEWEGDWRDVAAYAGITQYVLTDVAGTLVIEFSDDGLTADRISNVPIQANVPFTSLYSPRLRYFRMRYVNGAAPQTSFILSTLLGNSPPGPPVSTLSTIPTDNSLASTVRAIATGRTPDGSYSSVPIGGRDLANSKIGLLGANEEFLGPYKTAQGLASMLVFAFSDTPLATARLEWSTDGVNPAPGIINTTNLLTTVQEFPNPLVPGTSFYIYLTVVTTIIDKFYRLRLVNGPVAQTAFGEADVWTYDKPFTGSFGSLTANLSSLSTALLTRAVQAGVSPDGGFTNIRSQGRHSLNSTTALLNGDTGGSDHIFRGTWVEWQASFGGLILDMHSDVPGTLHIDFSEVADPVDGTEESVTLSQSVDYDPSNLLFRRGFPTQSRWVRIRYENGLTAQSVFGLDTAFLTAYVMPSGPLSDVPTEVAMGVNVKALGFVETSEDANTLDRNTGTLVGQKRALDQNLVGIETTVPQRSIRHLSTGQGIVTSEESLPYPAVPHADRASVLYTNLDPLVPMWFSEDPVKLATGQGGVLLPLAEKSFDLTEDDLIYWRIDDQGGETTTTEINGTTTQNNVGVTDPGNLILDDPAYAIFDALTDSVEATGFTAAMAQDVIGSIKLQLEGHKAATPVTETVQWVGATTTTAGNVATVPLEAVPYSPTQQYLLAISRRNAASVVTAVVGMGVSWVQVGDVSGANGETRVSLWRPTTQPEFSGSVTVSFSALPTNSTIAMSRFSGVNLNSPIEEFETISGAVNANDYSGEHGGSDEGMQAVFVSMRERTHTPGGTFTEQVEIRTGLTATDASLAIATDQLFSSAPEPYSGTISGNVGLSVIAITLRPAVTPNPVIRVRYRVGAEAIGLTALTATLVDDDDVLFEADVTADRPWTYADLNALVLLIDTLAVGGAPAYVRRVGILETDVDEGNSARLAYEEIWGTM